MILYCIPFFSQEEIFCATEAEVNTNYTYSGSTNPVLIESFTPIVYKVYYWQINDINGETIDPLTETEALESIANLNMYYNEYNLFFKYAGLGEIDSPPSNPGYTNDENENGYGNHHGFGWLQVSERSYLYSYVANPTVYGGPDEVFLKPDAINIYVPYALNFGGSGGGTGSNKLISSSDGLMTRTLPHEFGHNFGLQHTQIGYANTHKPDNLPSSCEHVTRDSSLVGVFNADVAGDDVVDTSAVPDFRSEYCYRNFGVDADCVSLTTSLPEHTYEYINPVTCIYTVGSNSCEGLPYEIFPEDLNNIMSYNLPQCSNQFSPGQVIRIFETITSTESYSLMGAETTFSELYEPYKGSYYVAGPVLPQSEKPLLQPGFDYWFIECNGPFPQPADYNENFYYNSQNKISQYTKNEQNYNSITHPNHTAIKIKQVETSLGFVNIQKCYDNFNLSPTGGSVTKFNDNIINTNVTITTKDSLQINSDTMIDDLPQGLYKVEKIYNDGAIEQTVILKENK